MGRNSSASQLFHKRLFLYFCNEESQENHYYNAYDKDIAVVNVFFGSSTVFGLENYIFCSVSSNLHFLRIWEITKDDLAGFHIKPWRTLWALSWNQFHFCHRICVLVHYKAFSGSDRTGCLILKANKRRSSKMNVIYLFEHIQGVFRSAWTSCTTFDWSACPCARPQEFLRLLFLLLLLFFLLLLLSRHPWSVVTPVTMVNPPPAPRLFLLLLLFRGSRLLQMIIRKEQPATNICHTYVKFEKIAIERIISLAFFGEFWGQKPRLYREFSDWQNLSVFHSNFSA